MFIGSIRRECTDHLIAFNAEHLRRIPAKYAIYYNEVRPHVSLGKDAPCARPIQRFGGVVAHPILGGLHLGTLECRFRKQDIRKLEIQACAAQDKETLSTGEEPSGRYTVWGDLSAIAGITRTLRSPASWAHFST
jgi:hypothetical protein